MFCIARITGIGTRRLGWYRSDSRQESVEWVERRSSWSGSALNGESRRGSVVVEVKER